MQISQLIKAINVLNKRFGEFEAGVSMQLRVMDSRLDEFDKRLKALEKMHKKGRK